MAPRLLLAALVLVHAHRAAAFLDQSFLRKSLHPIFHGEDEWKPEPERCRARLSPENCGAPPRPLFTYIRTAERCEVILWRGCAPSSPGNIFRSEHDCIRSCIIAPVSERRRNDGPPGPPTAEPAETTPADETPAPDDAEDADETKPTEEAAEGEETPAPDGAEEEAPAERRAGAVDPSYDIVVLRHEGNKVKASNS